MAFEDLEPGLQGSVLAQDGFDVPAIDVEESRAAVATVTVLVRFAQLPGDALGCCLSERHRKTAIQTTVQVTIQTAVSQGCQEQRLQAPS